MLAFSRSRIGCTASDHWPQHHSTIVSVPWQYACHQQGQREEAADVVYPRAFWIGAQEMKMALSEDGIDTLLLGHLVYAGVRGTSGTSYNGPERTHGDAPEAQERQCSLGHTTRLEG